MLISLIVLIVLILLNAFFAASEMALVSLNDTRIRLMAEEGNKKAIKLRNLLGEPSKFLSPSRSGSRWLACYPAHSHPKPLPIRWLIICRAWAWLRRVV